MKDNSASFIIIALFVIIVSFITFILWARGVEGFPANTADTIEVCPTCGRAPYPLLPPEDAVTPVPEDDKGFELDLFHLRFPKRKYKNG